MRNGRALGLMPVCGARMTTGRAGRVMVAGSAGFAHTVHITYARGLTGAARVIIGTFVTFQKIADRYC